MTGWSWDPEREPEVVVRPSGRVVRRWRASDPEDAPELVTDDDAAGIGR